MGLWTLYGESLKSSLVLFSKSARKLEKACLNSLCTVSGKLNIKGFHNALNRKIDIYLFIYIYSCLICCFVQNTTIFSVVDYRLGERLIKFLNVCKLN